MKFHKRFLVSFLAEVVVMASYSFALKLPSQVNSDFVLSVLVGGAVCCGIGALLSSLIFKSHQLAMILVAQVLSILIVGALWHWL